MVDTERSEQGQKSPTSEQEIVKEIPETPEIPEYLEKAAQPVPTQITQQVTDDSGKPITTSQATKKVTITLPAPPTQLANWAQGSPTSSLTWFAAFWLRLMKKALHFGWRVVMKEK